MCDFVAAASSSFPDAIVPVSGALTPQKERVRAAALALPSTATVGGTSLGGAGLTQPAPAPRGAATDGTADLRALSPCVPLLPALPIDDAPLLADAGPGLQPTFASVPAGDLGGHHAPGTEFGVSRSTSPAVTGRVAPDALLVRTLSPQSHSVMHEPATPCLVET
eukprot:CAMPEP_0174872172 /NCGR_PEP_ID=MMETSP1114-20130205/72826_1 /TAXON_ID=312471 /ORGANISM="Neobodo designis, Strain CCAP 1951/1" /LENGTH=164 /DNA_ID=CAMNT_0016107467 /DNA_START=67 /DNA_END=561 /DNA_ORIENTATION=+